MALAAVSSPAKMRSNATSSSLSSAQGLLKSDIAGLSSIFRPGEVVLKAEDGGPYQYPAAPSFIHPR